MRSVFLTTVIKMTQRKSYHAEFSKSPRIKQAGLQNTGFSYHMKLLKKIKLYNLISAVIDSPQFSLRCRHPHEAKDL